MDADFRTVISTAAAVSVTNSPLDCSTLCATPATLSLRAATNSPLDCSSAEVLHGR